MRRVKKYKAIQIALRMEGYINEDVGDYIGRSADYVSTHFRMVDGKTFRLSEAYAILDFMGIPRERIFEFFPPDGESIEDSLRETKSNTKKDGIFLYRKKGVS